MWRTNFIIWHGSKNTATSMPQSGCKNVVFKLFGVFKSQPKSSAAAKLVGHRSNVTATTLAPAS